MNYEKAYKEALERAKELNCVSDKDSLQRKTVEHIFPELKESEDERIRKAIYIYLDWLDGKKDVAPKGEYSIRDMIAWLEKQGENKYTQRDIDDAYQKGYDDGLRVNLEMQDEQNKKMKKDIAEFIFNSREDIKHRYDWIKCLGYDVKFFEDEKQSEQKPADKVEPKFKVGDCILIDNPCQIESIDNNGNYIVRYCDAEETHLLSKNFCDSHFHLWTIQDAKDGDVLAGHESIVIFKEIDGFNIKCYCTYHFMNFTAFYLDTLQNKDSYLPATQEQQKHLFNKMKEAGYEWDGEKKELKKPQRIVSAEAKEAMYDKPAWSEEDENFMFDTISNLAELKDRYGAGYGNVGKCIDWLRNLKERVQPQPKQEWSEEDETIIHRILAIYSDFVRSFEISPASTKVVQKDVDEIETWLKSLRPQKQWKPSEEQMKALMWCACYEPSNNDVLKELYEQLKKL